MLKVGIIGFGRIGAEHARWIDMSGAARVAGVFDPTPARCDIARAAGLMVFERLDDLLNNPSVDAALISSPTSMHYEHATSAIEAGKHVMVEKPVAMNAPETRELIDRSKSRSVRMSVFHNRRWDLDFLVARAMVADGRLGRVFNVESRLGQFASCVGPAAREWRAQWRNESAFGGGGLYDWGSHFIDQVWQLMLPARAVRVFSQLRGNVWTRDCDDFARVLIDFDNGGVGLVEINTTTRTPLPRWHFDGTIASATSQPSQVFDVDVWANFAVRGEGGPVAVDDLRARAIHSRKSESAIWNEFALACRGEGEPSVEPETVIETMKLLDAARESSRAGRAVEL